MKQKPQPTKIKKKEPIRVADIFFDLIEFKEHPITENGIKKIAYNMLKWAKEDPKAFKLGPYLRELGISHATWRKWNEKFPWVAEVFEEVKICIGDRREIGALENKLNTTIVMWTMAHYDPDWKSLVQWRNDLKIEQSNASPANQVVVIEKFPESNKTPEEVAKQARRINMISGYHTGSKERDEL